MRRRGVEEENRRSNQSSNSSRGASGITTSAKIDLRMWRGGDGAWQLYVGREVLLQNVFNGVFGLVRGERQEQQHPRRLTDGVVGLGVGSSIPGNLLCLQTLKSCVQTLDSSEQEKGEAALLRSSFP